MKKKKKASLLLLALLLSFSPARSDDSFWPITAMVLGSVGVFVGGIYYLVNLPDHCPACDYAIKDGSSKVRRHCGHDFHADCYNPRAVCRYCEKEQQRAAAFAEMLSTVCDAQEKRRLQEEYEREVLAREAKNAQQKEMQRVQREKQVAEDRALAERLAAQEQRNATAYQASRSQQEALDTIAKNNQEKVDRAYAQQLAQEEQRKAQVAELQRQELAQRNAENARREQERKKQEQVAADKRLAESFAAEERIKMQAVENAQREQELKWQKQAQAAEKRQKDTENKRREEERVLQDKEIKNAEQARIKNTGWMMQECVICQEPRAWDDEKNCLIDLTKPENKLHRVALPCGHVFHTKCIKDWGKTGNHTCPECRTPFKAADL